MHGLHCMPPNMFTPVPFRLDELNFELTTLKLQVNGLYPNNVVWQHSRVKSVYIANKQ